MTTMISKLRRSVPVLATGALLAVAASGCTLVEIEATLEETCLTYKELAIEPPPIALGGDLEQTFELDDLGGLQDLADLDADVHFVRFRARAVSGITSFDFVESATVTIRSADPTSALPSLIAYHCAGTCDTGNGEIDIPAMVEVDALQYLGEDALAIDLQLSGQVPAVAFSISADICVEGSVNYSLQP